MRKLIRIIKLTTAIVLIALLLVFMWGEYLTCSADYKTPDVAHRSRSYQVIHYGDTAKTCATNTLLRNRYGLWELTVSGTPYERGRVYGILTHQLMAYQEDTFIRQIHRMIGSEFWIRALHRLILIFNRNMASHIPTEYRQEIYGISLTSSHRYDAYGTPYVRQLNYHAAHDIGHALQEYMLVGCSAFAAWGTATRDHDLIIGRNFDFYVGEEFARNKLILIMKPDKGYRYVSVTWPGMVGVVSGINEKGLTVTLNAAKGGIPLSSALPVSLLARCILQYAKNIREAYVIAASAQTFVSESLLIGSAQDSTAAIIEKSPTRIGLFRSQGSYLISTNHYQSKPFLGDKDNIDNIQNTDSPYRQARINQLIGERMPLGVEDAAAILRDRYGLRGKDIGLTNEKSINQFIGHHSVIFAPQRLMMWVSTSPWQLGPFVAYDLKKVFETKTDKPHSLAEDKWMIPIDSVSYRRDYDRVMRYRRHAAMIKEATADKQYIPPTLIKQLIDDNPEYFMTYRFIGDYFLSVGKKAQALIYWKKALTKEIARKDEREDIKKLIHEYE